MSSIRASKTHIGRKIDEVHRIYEEIRNYEIPAELKQDGGFSHKLWAQSSTEIILMREKMKLKCHKVYEQIARTENLIGMMRDDVQVIESKALEEYCEKYGTNRIGDYLNDAAGIITLLSNELGASRIREIHSRLRDNERNDIAYGNEWIHRSARPAHRNIEAPPARRFVNSSGGETPLLEGSPIWLRHEERSAAPAANQSTVPVANLLGLEEEIRASQNSIEPRETSSTNQWSYPVDNHYVDQEYQNRNEDANNSQANGGGFGINNCNSDDTQVSLDAGISSHVVHGVPLCNRWGTNQQATAATRNNSTGRIIENGRGMNTDFERNRLPSEPRQQATPNNRQRINEPVHLNQRNDYMFNVNESLQNLGFQLIDPNRNRHASVKVFPGELTVTRMRPQQPVYGNQDVRSHQVMGGPYNRPPTQMGHRTPLPNASPTPGRYENVPVVDHSSNYFIHNDPYGNGMNCHGTSNQLPRSTKLGETGTNQAPNPSGPIGTKPYLAEDLKKAETTNAADSANAQTGTNTGTAPASSEPSASTTTTPPTATKTGMDALAQFIDNRSRTPIMPLTVFDGCSTKWKKWWAIFSYTVHNNATMDKTQKMLHLVSNVSGEAALIIEPAEADEDKYELCIESLKKRYERPQDTRRNLVERLQAIPRCTKEVKQIRDTYTRIKSGFDCLNSLEVNETNTLMLELVKQKFPENIQSKIGKWVHELGTEWTMTKMLEKLEKFVIAEEAGKPKSTIGEARITTLPATIIPDDSFQQRPSRSFSPNSHENSRELSENRARATFNYRRDIQRPVSVIEALSNRGCGLCEKEGHHAAKCRTIKDPVSRRRIVNKNRLCYGCLSANHIARDCDAVNCNKCDGKHHVSLCLAEPMEREEIRDHSPGRYSPEELEFRGKEHNYQRDGSSFQQAPRTTPSP